MTVAALFVDPKGVYSGLEDVELWDEARDARLYEGPWPVVAHPPCARWSTLAAQVETRYGYQRGEDGGCFEAALQAVRTYGGVLEHPAHSHAWRHFALPYPLRAGGWVTSLTDEGWSCWVDQGWYGHAYRKPTWLYAHGVELPGLKWGIGPGEVLPHRNTTMSESERKRLMLPTPPPFAHALVTLARTATARRHLPTGTLAR